MSINEINAFDFDDYITAVYDQSETDTDDFELIRKLINRW
jgi:hypothetical protein